MSVLLHASDTHFGTERQPVVDALVDLCATLEPDLAVLSGDLTQRARRRQFDAARRFVERLRPVPALVIPGNHDIPLFNLYARLRHPYANHKRAFGDDLEPGWSGSGLHVVGVNTTRPRRHKHGEIGIDQIRRVADALRAAPASSLRVVVTHQPVHVTRAEDERNLLRGAREAAVRAWRDAGADLFLGGHIHLPYVEPLQGRYPSLPGEAWVVQAGTAVSHRTRAGIPNSVHVIRFQERARPSQCRIERYDYDAGHCRFERVIEHALSLDARATLIDDKCSAC